jgi:hypothetical protein
LIMCLETLNLGVGIGSRTHVSGVPVRQKSTFTNATYRDTNVKERHYIILGAPWSYGS